MEFLAATALVLRALWAPAVVAVPQLRLHATGVLKTQRKYGDKTLFFEGEGKM